MVDFLCGDALGGDFPLIGVDHQQDTCDDEGDVERAQKESPYKSTIAHGYLTLSLLPYLWDQIIEVNNLKMMVNYGMDKMRFGQPVITGSSVRLVTTLQSIVNLRGTCKAEIKFTIEIKDQRKHALEGVATFLYYFNN